MDGKGVMPGGGCLLALIVLAVFGAAGVVYAAARAVSWLIEHVRVG